MNAIHNESRRAHIDRGVRSLAAIAVTLLLAACADAPTAVNSPRLDYGSPYTCLGLTPTIHLGMANQDQHFTLLPDGRWSVLGTTRDDVILGTANGDDLFGGDGDDVICGEGGDDLMNGGPGNDRMHGGFGNDLMGGAEGNDVVEGSAGDDHLEGNDGDDTLVGGPENDYVNGGAGVDQVGGGQGTDRCVDAEAGTFVNCETFPGAPGEAFKLAFELNAINWNPSYPDDPESTLWVRVQDAFGNNLPGVRPVKLTVANGPAGGCLRDYDNRCWAPEDMTYGNPPFAVLIVSLPRAGTYTLWMTSPGLESVSISGRVEPNSTSQEYWFYAFRSVPNGKVNPGWPFKPTGWVITGTPFDLEVELQDAWGNAMYPSFPHSGAVSLTATGPDGGVLNGTTTIDMVSGVAHFTGLSFNRPGTYMVKACGVVCYDPYWEPGKPSYDGPYFTFARIVVVAPRAGG